MEKVAVLLPVYAGDDKEKFDEALLSLAKQKTESISLRIYIGIDGPVPQSVENVLEKHEKYIYKKVRHLKNIGPTKNLNSLIRVLEDEEYVFRMDADDFSMPERFRLQLDFLKNNPDIDVLGGAIIERNMDNGYRNEKFYPVSHQNIIKMLPAMNPIAHPTVCFRRRFIEYFGGYPDTRNQDWALWFLAAEREFKMANLREVLVEMKVDDNFYIRRRSFKRSLPEFALALKGTFRLYGVNWRLVFPFLRFAFRMAPLPIAKIGYNSSIRTKS